MKYTALDKAFLACDAIFNIMEYMTAHQALARATEILDCLAQQRERSATVAEIALACDIPEASAHRLLQALKAIDWVDQLGPRQPYRLGPRAWSLTSGQAYLADVIDAVRPDAQKCAQKTGLVVVLAGMRGAQRQTIGRFYAQGLDPSRSLPYESSDLYSTSGGRLLFAMLSRKARLLLINEIGLPGPKWQGILDRDELFTELDDIRRQKLCTIQRGAQMTTSVLLRFPKTSPLAARGDFALGCFGHSGKDEGAVHQALQTCVQHIHAKTTV